MRRLLQWWLDRLFTHEIKSRDGDKAYLTRYYIFGHPTSPWAVMLHEMHAPDDDACHHDHPWPFATLILKGGYEEEVTEQCPCGDYDCPNNRHGRALIYDRRNGPGRIRFNGAQHAHRITKLPKGKCWTLVLRLKKKRSWGFWTREGWTYWVDFLARRQEKGVAWCGRER